MVSRKWIADRRWKWSWMVGYQVARAITFNLGYDWLHEGFEERR